MPALLSWPTLYTCSKTTQICGRFFPLFLPENWAAAWLALQLPGDQHFSSAGHTTPGLFLVMVLIFYHAQSTACCLLSFHMHWGISFAWQIFVGLSKIMSGFSNNGASSNASELTFFPLIRSLISHN